MPQKIYEIIKEMTKDKIQSTHTAAHIDLASGMDLKDRVNDRGEGD